MISGRSRIDISPIEYLAVVGVFRGVALDGGGAELTVQSLLSYKNTEYAGASVGREQGEEPR